MSEDLVYQVLPSGEFQVATPPPMLASLIGGIMRRGLADSVTIGSVEHGDTEDSVKNFLFRAKPLPGKKPAMETFLRKHEVLNLNAKMN